MSARSNSPNQSPSSSSDGLPDQFDAEGSLFTGGQHKLLSPLSGIYRRSLQTALNFNFEEAKVTYIDDDSSQSVDSNYNEFAVKNDRLRTSGRDFVVLDKLLRKTEQFSAQDDVIRGVEDVEKLFRFIKFSIII